MASPTVPTIVEPVPVAVSVSVRSGESLICRMSSSLTRTVSSRKTEMSISRVSPGASVSVGTAIANDVLGGALRVIAW